MATKAPTKGASKGKELPEHTRTGNERRLPNQKQAAIAALIESREAGAKERRKSAGNKASSK